ncbi:MAG: AI-2E family transporter [Acidobacteriota bacterium]|nr:AI-2E family transporter [Acidobacteriota bacterium]
MLGLSSRAARYTWTAALVLLLLYIAYTIRGTLFILTISILFAYLLYPLVDFLNGHLPSRSRAPALAIVYLTLIGLLVLLGVEVGSRAAEQAASLSQRAPEFLDKMKQQPPAITLPNAVHSFQQTAITALQTYVYRHYSEWAAVLPKATFEVLKASTDLIYLIIIPVLSFFILKDGRTMRDELLGIVDPGRARELIDEILADVHVMLLQYMRALLSLCSITFVTFSIVLKLLGVPYSILLASIAFPLEFIPLIGPLIAAVVIIAVALLTGYPHVLWIVLFLGAYRMMQDYVVSPRLMSSGVELHPMLVILGVFAGGEIAGIAGTFLSVPVLALLRVVYHRIRVWQLATRQTELVR